MSESPLPVKVFDKREIRGPWFDHQAEAQITLGRTSLKEAEDSILNPKTKVDYHQARVAFVAKEISLNGTRVGENDVANQLFQFVEKRNLDCSRAITEEEKRTQAHNLWIAEN